MPDFWISLLAFVLCVILLYWLQHWITQHMQGIGLLIFNSSNAGMALLWFVLFPGIILHEASHWIMARLLGLKTGRFRVWPPRLAAAPVDSGASRGLVLAAAVIFDAATRRRGA